MLLGDLFQELYTEAEGVRPVGLGHCVLHQIVFGNAELRNVGGDANCRQISDADVRQREGQCRIGRRNREVEID